MILNTPPEPTDLRDWMQSLKRSTFNDPTINWDAYVVWAGNKLPKYFWDHWKGDLKAQGITWQKFMWILRQRTDVSILWYQGKLPWVDFVQKIIELLKSPIGKDFAVKNQPTGNVLPPKDLGAIQIAAPNDWQVFERLTRDLWSRVWDNPELQLNGRSGQAQAGVDIFGDIKKQAGNTGGVQCKRRDAFADDSLTTDELRQIVEEAKAFAPTLREFVVAYTGKRDVSLQEVAREISEKNQATGLFSVRVCAWDDIKDLLASHPDLVELYGLIATGVSAKAILEVKQTADSILKSQLEQNSNTKVVAQNVNSIRGDLAAVHELTKSIASGGELTGEYANEIDEIRDLINSSRAKEALDRIEILEKRIRPDVAPSIKFRVLTNKAASLSTLGEDEKAGLLFIEAFQYNPEDEKALCNKALGHLFIGQREEAAKIVEQVLIKNPTSQRAYELLAYTAAPSERLQSIIDRIPEVLRKNESVAYAIAHAAREREMRDETMEWLETSLTNVDPQKPAPDLKATIATSILLAFEQRHDIQAGMQLTDADREKLERAISLLDDAIKTLENSETLKYRTNWVGNRAVAHKLLGNREKALVDAEYAIRLQPDQPGFLRQKAFLLHEMGKSDEAVVLFKALLGKPEVPEVALLLAGIFHEREEDDAAIPILEKSLENTDKPQDLLSEERRLLIHAYMRKKRYDDARKISNALRSANPGSVVDLVIAARIEKMANDLVSHAQLLDEARTYVADGTPMRGMFELADELYASKRYVEAWPLYERLVDPRSGSPLVGKLIYSYYESELYEKALEAARVVPEAAKSRFVYDVEVSILESMGDLAGAIAASEKYLVSHPEDLAFKVKWATYLLRDGRDEQTTKLDRFLDEAMKLSQFPEDLRFNASRQLAWLYSQRNQSLKALDIAYRLRKELPRNGDAHTTYMGIFFDREKALDNQFSPKEAAIDTAVAVEEAGSNKRWYVIETEPGNDKDALSPDDHLAKKLLGKKVNDEIVQDEGKPSETRLKIVEIKSKYVYALHDTMEKFPHLFGEGDNPPLKRFTVKTNPEAEEETRNQLMQIMDTTAARDEHILRVQKLYEEGKLPIGTFANLIGRDPITIWGGLVNKPRIGIRCCAGTLEERQAAIALARESKAVAVDITGLLTLGSMNRLNLLKQGFDEIFVVQSTKDLLTQEIAEKSGMSSKGFMTVWKEDGKYYRQEVSAEDIQKQIAFLSKIKDWLDANATVAPMTEILKLPKERRERLYETIGESFVDTMMIAKERQCPLYTDDHGTREVARNDFEVKGFWTQVLAIVGLDKGTLAPDELEAVNTSLCELNYRHTTISALTLMHTARKATWTPTGSFTTVLAGITGPRIEIGSAMGVAVEFFYHLWKDPAVSDLQRESLVFGVLDAVAQGKERVEVLKYAAALTQRRFQLAPIAGKHLLKLLAAWRSIRS